MTADFFERLPVNFIFPTSRPLIHFTRRNATTHLQPDFHVAGHPRHLSFLDFFPETGHHDGLRGDCDVNN
jgi:hypothetical protein